MFLAALSWNHVQFFRPRNGATKGLRRQSGTNRCKLTYRVVIGDVLFSLETLENVCSALIHHKNK